MLGRAAAGSILLVGIRLLTRLSDLGTMLVLARVLDPSSFGLVAIALSVVVIFEAALELPLHNILLRRAEITRDYLDTAFTLSIIRGVAIGLILLGISIPFGKFYQDERLILLVCALSLAPVFRGLISPKLATFQRNLSFWRDVLIEGISKIIASAVAIAIALNTQSYWAIAVGTVLYPIAMTFVSYVLAPYRPRFGLAHFRDFLDILGWNTAAQILSAINWQIERLLLGRIRSPRELGLYTTAYDLASIPFLVIFAPILRPLYATLTHAMEDMDRLRATYKTTSSALFAIGLPLLVGVSCVAEPLVRFVLGERWMASVPYVQWLALCIVPALFTIGTNSLFMALGNTKLSFQRNLVEFLFKLPAVIVLGITWGIPGAILARFLSELVAGAFCMITVKRLINLSVYQQIFSSWRSIFSAAILVPAVYFADIYFVTGAAIDIAGLQLMILASAGALAYFITHLILWVISGCPYGVETLSFRAAKKMMTKTGLVRPT